MRLTHLLASVAILVPPTCTSAAEVRIFGCTMSLDDRIHVNADIDNGFSVSAGHSAIRAAIHFGANGDWYKQVIDERAALVESGTFREMPIEYREVRLQPGAGPIYQFLLKGPDRALLVTTRRPTKAEDLLVCPN